MNTRINQVMARRVWDSRGRPTVEAEVRLAGGEIGRAIAPAGASKGGAEALDKRDGGKAFGGYDVLQVIDSVNIEINRALVGHSCMDQQGIDQKLITLDGTSNKSRLGGNATIAVSMAAAQAAAVVNGIALWEYLAQDRSDVYLPLPEIQIFGGGVHAGRRVDVQDFMLMAVGAKDYEQALEWTAEVYRTAGQLMNENGRLMGVADEGGYWPAFESNEMALDYMLRAIDKTGLIAGQDVGISLDIAATDFGRNGRYRLARDRQEIDSDGLCEMLLGWLDRYPIVAIEDPLAEDDDQGMVKFTQAVAGRVQVVADDFICTSAKLIKRAAAIGACNTALIKPNQVGTLTETQAALVAAREAGWDSIISARSGESEDVSIVHLAVGWGVQQLKVGSFSRSERMAKWNEGLRIMDSLNSNGSLRLPKILS